MLPDGRGSVERRGMEELLRRLRDGSVAERRQAAEALAQRGEEARAAAALAKAAGDQDEAVRNWAGSALESLGPPHATALAELMELCGHADPNVRYWAVTLIGRLGAEASRATSLLANLLEGSALEVRQRAAWALGKIGPAALGAIPSLRKAARSDDPRLSRLAANAVTEIEGR